MSNSVFEPVIGLEVHAELATRSKMFCGCAVVDSTQAEPNTVTCPVCTAMPGVLPVVNRRAVEFGMMTGLALHCTVQPLSVFARKNYFYPDLPKGYQISQYDLPLATGGYLDIETPAGTRRIRVRRVHLEEDTGKLTHVGDASLVDLNRAGVPLLEIVSEPDLRSVEEARLVAEGLRAILRYLGVNSGDMEKGVIRFEANISVRHTGTSELNTRTEVKNLNSFRALVRATEYEIARQSALYERGEPVIQQTMGWDEARGVTVPQRDKEHAHDYRYFPEPDLPPLVIAPDWIETVRAGLPELPEAKRLRFERGFGLPASDADLLARDRAVAAYFEQAVAAGGQPKGVANWVLGELFRALNEAGASIDNVKLTPVHLAELTALAANGTLSSTLAKQVFDRMLASGEAPAAIVQAQGLAQISDTGQLQGIIARVLDENPKPVADYLAGKEAIIKFLIGQAMKATKGKGNPQTLGDLMKEALEARRS
ncbi:MAG: Asp-tRNA(Asn)/Glu-tRNA(Gln) amidotransferase subunit GatB [Chloroflexi bacterium]|nr:Asp-tRNA(Asn)/Glu-tRNA(Gln) amidotransferase subunit GatB [Chloroflexota bacterium]